MSIFKKYGFAWVTLGFLIILSATGCSAGFPCVNEQQTHGAAIEIGGYVVELLRQTFESWQSEFL